MHLSIIVAISENGVIGRGGKLPWRLPGDLRRFKQRTTGHTIIMGRRTWESIGRPLADRRMVVISRQKDYDAAGCQVVSSLDDALAIARQAGDDEAFVIGGAELYRLALPQADRFYLTRVHTSVEGDTSLPEFDLSKWRLLESEQHGADADNEFAYTFEVYERT